MVLKTILNIFKKKKDSTFIALDLGTANTLAFVSGHGIIYQEPSLLAYDTRTNQLLSFGNEAFSLLGKTHEYIRITRPLIDGVISDLDATKQLVKNVFNKMKLMNIWRNATVILACPSGVTQLERTALKDVAKEMGATNVIIEEEVKLAALGAGINIKLPHGHLIVDIGGGTCNVAVISAGDIIISRSIKIAGNYFDEQIIKYLKTKYNTIIGHQTAIDIKHTIGSLIQSEEYKTMKIYGRDMLSGMPRKIEITQSEITEEIKPTFKLIQNTIIETLENTPEELAGDIIKNGITLCGGGAMFKSIDKYFEKEFNLPVRIAANPLMCVIEGAKTLEREAPEILKMQKLTNSTDNV